MRPNGDMKVNLTLDGLKLYLVTAIYLQLVDFIGMDDSVNPPPPKVVRDQLEKEKGLDEDDSDYENPDFMDEETKAEYEKKLKLREESKKKREELIAGKPVQEAQS